MRQVVFSASVAFCALLGACQQASSSPAAPANQAVTEDDASKAFNSTVEGWESADATRIKALYAPDFAGFDFTGPLITDRAAWDKTQDAFAAAKIDKITIKDKKIQLLGPDSFVVSSYGEDSSSTAGTNATFRCTDVYKRESAGSWLIVSENCSSPPTAG